ncbi:polysaccharide deacetylase family protein [uncultured Sphingomonas sp.]|uniref:polysaccharide deacetylase family protein n=1 Tax=uncultured Sphingomonas sp. TaxID=158754 RepID=UPI0025CFE1CF|nr:polysaccharide deacetylase family protein [uncultured Sphingomonas sp.]
MAALPHHGRYPYRPIVRRPDYSWPEGRRLALYLGVNHEVFAFGDGLGAELAPAKTDPDVMNFAWRDYGNRVGAWRFMEMFDRLELKTTALLNSAIIDHCPGLAEACRDRGDEIAAHGRTNAKAEGEQSEQGERDLIARTLEDFASIGVRPSGWLGPWISESRRTPDLLEEAGFDYVLDWAHDDQPTRLRTRSGKGI